jgi:glycosyltransferase involved in cell wall biosynthesis
MPCLNEAETLDVCIRKARDFLTHHSISGEIIVADNGSTDGSQSIAKRCGARVVDAQTRGYGAALMAGIEAARGRFIIMGDADDSYDFSALFPFVEKLRGGYELVMGCRLPSGGGTIMPGAMPLKHQYLGNPLLSSLGRIFFRSPVTDFHCGLRGFTKAAFERMALRTTGMEFASEMVVKATMLKMQITEVPITLYPDGRSRPPHLRSWRDGWRHLRFMLMYSPRWLFLIPGSVLFVLGSLAFFFLLPQPVSMGRVTFDTNTLLVAAMCVLLGFQLIIFYFFTKTFSITEGLIPEDTILDRLFSVFKLEAGIIAGTALLIVGAGFLAYSLLSWSRADFGPLSYSASLRQVIPAVTLIVLGAQVIFSSFFMSILGLSRK